MKHKLSLLLAGTMTLSLLLCACGQDDEASKPSETSSPPVSASQNSETPAPSGSAQITAPSEEPAQEPSESPAEPSGSETPEPSESPAEPSGSETPEPSESAPAEPSAEDAKETAMSLIGSNVEDLIEAIGEPDATDYAPSCLGSGEDGELIYDGFTVYTYREGDTETVQDVL